MSYPEGMHPLQPQVEAVMRLLCDSLLPSAPSHAATTAVASAASDTGGAAVDIRLLAVRGLQVV